MIQNDKSHTELRFWGRVVDGSVGRLLKRDVTIPLKLVPCVQAVAEGAAAEAEETALVAVEAEETAEPPSDAANAEGAAANAEGAAAKAEENKQETNNEKLPTPASSPRASAAAEADAAAAEGIIYFYVDGSAVMNTESSDCCLAYFITTVNIKKEKVSSVGIAPEHGSTLSMDRSFSGRLDPTMVDPCSCINA